MMAHGEKDVVHIYRYICIYEYAQEDFGQILVWIFQTVVFQLQI